MHTRMITLGSVMALAACATIAPAETVTISSNTPLPIPDLGSASVDMPGAAIGNPLIGSVEVDLDVTHPWVGDLVVTVAHQGVTVRLVDRIGLANYAFACGGDDIAASFMDTATTTPDDLCSPGPAPNITGFVLPVDALSAFAGLPIAGDWTVTLQDATAFDTGTMQGVAIRIVTAPPTECVGDINGDEITNSADFNILASHFGQSVPVGQDGDLTGDGLVNSGDFNVLAFDFGCDVHSE